jgi:hypothetical protein
VLRLVQDEVLPLEPAEAAVVLDDELVGGDADVEGVLFGPTDALQSPLLLASKVDKDLK